MAEIEFIVEKGIPVSPSRLGKRATGKTKYPWKLMEPGDSVHFENVLNAWGSASGYSFRNRHKGIKFVQRGDERGAGGRIWRVA